MNHPVHLISRNEEIRFKRNGLDYKYIWESTKSRGFAYIYDASGHEIYGPFNSTELGREVYADFFEQIMKNRP